MILDRLENAERYFPVHGLLQEAFEYIRLVDYATLPEGRHEIDGQKVYLIIERAAGRGAGGARLEAHRRYIDVQIPLNAPETMGWRAKGACRQVAQEYDEKTDVEFFADPPASWLTVEPGCLVIFFPDDAHAPLACEGTIHKAVIKIACD